MIFFPAIDLKDGKCVRLAQGDKSRMTTYNENPLDQAKIFEEHGITWIHCIDLDGAFEGDSKNLRFVSQILERTDLKIQFGGGVRDEKKVQQLIEIGVSNIIIGTRAYEDKNFFRELVVKYPNNISLALDIKNGLVSTKGWVEQLELDLDELFEELNELPLNSVICTDILRDGMKQGVNIDMLEKIMNLSKAPCVASGGIAKIENLIELKNKNYAKLKGVISGKAIYDNEISLTEALKVLK